jgi:hypothetical protein
VPTPIRTTIQGPSLIRLLARLAEINAPQPRQSPAEQLSQWIDWTRAVSLASALDARSPHKEASPPSEPATTETQRVRNALLEAIANDRAISSTAHAASDCVLDYGFFRQRYLALQQTMEISIAQLRAALRQMLEHGSSDMQRLAAVDLVMEQALTRRERTFLASIPNLLEHHYQRLRQSAQPAQQPEQDADEAMSSSAQLWPERFRNDMRNVLLAELDVRLQPVEGLLAAIRTR